MRLYIFPLLFLIALTNQLSGQNPSIIKGVLIDENTKEPLPYGTILVVDKNEGTISNEKGMFSLDVSKLSEADSIRFQYIGYKPQIIVLKHLDSIITIFLKEDLINLSEAFVFGNPPNAKDIIKKVLENKDKNYKRNTSKAQSFIRWRHTSDIQKSDIITKKNNIDELNEAALKMAAEKIPKYNTSYTDFLGNLYFLGDKNDTLKIDPIRVVSLKKEEIAELEKMGEIFENLFVDTDEEEYWKVKSGILSQKLDIEDSDNDTIEDENSTKIENYSSMINYRLNYGLFNDEDKWEFLHKTGKYNYELLGGSKVNGEDVYIIDFSPKGSGKYEGRVYITLNSYALIRADYQFATGVTGRNFDLLGVNYKENHFSGSIYFVKQGDYYALKYFTNRNGQFFGVDRKVSLIKKKKRTLWDKKLKQLKVGINFQVSSEESLEVLFLSNEQITEKEFVDFKQDKSFNMIYVDQFNDDLWKGYPIIEPTKRMREYIKPEE